MISEDSVLLRSIIHGILFLLHVFEIIVSGFAIMDQLDNTSGGAFGFAIALVIIHGIFAIIDSLLFTLNFATMLKSQDMDYETIICFDNLRLWIFVEYIPNLFLAIVASILIVIAGNNNGGFPISIDDFYILLFTIPQIIYGGVPIIIVLVLCVIFLIVSACSELKEKSIKIIEDFENIKIRKPPVNLP